MSNGATPTKVKAKRKAPGPKAFYLVYTTPSGDELIEHAFSRKTDDVLTAMSEVDGAKVKKLMAEPGR